MTDCHVNWEVKDDRKNINNHHKKQDTRSAIRGDILSAVKARTFITVTSHMPSEVWCDRRLPIPSPSLRWTPITLARNDIHMRSNLLPQIFNSLHFALVMRYYYIILCLLFLHLFSLLRFVSTLLPAKYFVQRFIFPSWGISFTQ